LSNLDWYQLVVPEAGVYTGPGVSSAIAANRISCSAENRVPQLFQKGDSMVYPQISDKAILFAKIQRTFCFGWFISNEIVDQ